MDTKNKIAISAALGGICFGAAALYSNLVTRYYTVASNKIAENDAIRLVMLSDLHGYTYQPNQKPLLAKVHAQKPDYIMLCGDVFDDKLPQDGAELLLKELVKIAPCYYVCGNHEIWRKDKAELFEWIESMGVMVLHDTSIQVKKNSSTYRICGIMDPAVFGTGVQGDYGSRELFCSKLAMFDLADNDAAFNILLSHRPEYIVDYAKHSFDLVLCGHAHGGQWRIPHILNGLFAPNQGLFPKYAGGAYKVNHMTQIVGRGLIRDWKPRIFNPPEVVVVDIRKK